MPKVARRVGVAIGAFVLAWLAATLIAGWLFGSANILAWVIAAVAGAAAYIAVLRRDQRVGRDRLRDAGVRVTRPMSDRVGPRDSRGG